MYISENNSGTLIFPHHLFWDNPALSRDRKVFIIEEQLFFGDYKFQINFHQKKLVLHRASLKYYFDLIKERNYDVTYLEYCPDGDMTYLFDELEDEGIKKLYCVELIDFELKKRLNHFCTLKNMELVELEGPGFLTSLKWIDDYFENKKKYFLTSFYIAQRKRLNILIKEGKPFGGKWGYDTQNRKRIPNDMEIPNILELDENHYIEEARDYVNTNFSENPGDTDNFFYPVTHHDAKTWFSDFIEHRFKYFGHYEDFISMEEPFLFHSIISSSLNIGL